MALAPIYYRGAAAAIVVFDVTRAESFKQANMWVKELRESMEEIGLIALVGNKIDLED